MLPVSISSLYISHPYENILEIRQCPVERTSFCTLPIFFPTPCSNFPMEQLEIWYPSSSNSLIVLFSRICLYGFLVYPSTWLIQGVLGQRKKTSGYHLM